MSKVETLMPQCLYTYYENYTKYMYMKYKEKMQIFSLNGRSFHGLKDNGLILKFGMFMVCRIKEMSR